MKERMEEQIEEEWKNGQNTGMGKGTREQTDK